MENANDKIGVENPSAISGSDQPPQQAAPALSLSSTTTPAPPPQAPEESSSDDDDDDDSASSSDTSSEDSDDSSSSGDSSSSEPNVQEGTEPGTYRLPDTEPILGPITGKFFRDLLHRKRWEHRKVDEFKFGLRMFVASLHNEKKAQEETAKKNKREFTKFTWKNTGGFAEDFAILCDTASAIHALIPQSDRGNLKAFLSGLCSFLIVYTGVSPDVLSGNTYDTKINDYMKGGTRYGSGVSNNVEFASKEKRLDKLKAYMESNATVYKKCSSKIVGDGTPHRSISSSSKKTSGSHEKPKSEHKKTSEPPGAALPTAPSKPVAPVKVPMKVARPAVMPTPTPRATSVDHTAEEQRHRLQVILGSGNKVLIGSRVTMVEPFVALTRITQVKDIRGKILEVVRGVKESNIFAKLEEFGWLDAIQAWIPSPPPPAGGSDVGGPDLALLHDIVTAIQSFPNLSFIGLNKSIQLLEKIGAIFASVSPPPSPEFKDLMEKLLLKYREQAKTKEQTSKVTPHLPNTPQPPQQNNTMVHPLLSEEEKKMLQQRDRYEAPLISGVLSSPPTRTHVAPVNGAAAIQYSTETVIIRERDPRLLLAGLMGGGGAKPKRPREDDE